MQRADRRRSAGRQVAKGMKSGSVLAALRPFLARRLPSGAFPTGSFLAAFAGCFPFGFWSWPIAFVAFAGLDLSLGMPSPIRGQGSADIIGLNERRARLVAAHKTLIGAGVDQFALTHHPEQCIVFFRCGNRRRIPLGVNPPPKTDAEGMRHRKPPIRAAP